MGMGVCTLVTAASAEVTRLNAPHGAPVASVGGCDSSSKPLCDGGRGARPEPRRLDGRERRERGAWPWVFAPW